MGGRIFWILLTGLALIAGAALQGSMIFDWDGESRTERATEAAVETRVERAVEGRRSRLEVVGSDGRTIDVSPETKRELGRAVGRLAAAEADLALLRIRDGDETALREARSRSGAARAEVERLKGQIDSEKQLSERDRHAIRTQIRQEIRETIRSAVRG